MRARWLAVGACLALMTWAVPGTAIADSPVVITSAGPAQVIGSTEVSTGPKSVTFDIFDASLTATGATICRRTGSPEVVDCRYERFDGVVTEDSDDYYYSDDEYERWGIIGAPGHWTVSYPIGFPYMTREQCVDAAWIDAKGSPYAAIIEVMNDAGTVLASNTWSYEVYCTGLLGGAQGPKRTRVFAGRSSSTKPFEFYVLDKRHLLESYRICVYDSLLGRYHDCDREDLRKRDRTASGWYLNYTIDFPAMGSDLCGYIGRTWPQSGLRIQFYDQDFDKQVTVYWGTRLNCG